MSDVAEQDEVMAKVCYDFNSDNQHVVVLVVVASCPRHSGSAAAGLEALAQLAR